MNKVQDKESEFDYEQSQKPTVFINPSLFGLGLLLFGIVALFLGVMLSYSYTIFTNPSVNPLQLPIIFLVNTVFLLGTSWFIKQANVAYQDDNTEKYTKSLIYVLISTVLFILAQAVAWFILQRQGIHLVADSPMSSYIYILAILHVIHVLGGLPFLCFFIFVAVKRMKDPVSVFVYFSDPEKHLKLRMLTTYWHFLDVLWIVLIVFLFGMYWLAQVV